MAKKKITNEDIIKKLDEILKAIQNCPPYPPYTYTTCPPHNWEWIANDLNINYGCNYGYWKCSKCGAISNWQYYIWKPKTNRKQEK